MTNVFSLADMEDKYRVTYDSAKESAFIVHAKNGPVRFTCSPENLYYYKPKYQGTTTGMTLVETLSENMKFYTPHQVECARQARKLLHVLGCPTIPDLKAIIQSNAINNCPVTIDDINMAEKIFGKDIIQI